MTLMKRSRFIPVVALVTALAASGCTPTAAGPVTTPGTVLAADRVPAPPATASDAVAGSWAALRISGTVPAATALSPTDRATPAGQAYEGFRALRVGDLAAAQNAFGAALGALPDLAEAQYGMGLAADAQGRADLAQQWFEAALRSDPGMTRAAVELNRLSLSAVTPMLRRAEQAVAAGDPATAAAAYREVLSRAPFLVGPYVRIAELHLAAGATDQAISALGRAQASLGDEPAILRMLGGLLMQEGRYAEAADAYRRLADRLPDDAEVAERARAARDAYERAALPVEYRDLASKESLTREELAAVLAIQLEALEAVAAGRVNLIVADAGDRWTTPFILRTVEWGVLDVYQNNEFYPRMEVLRSMLVEAAYRVLEIVGAADTAPTPALVEPPPEHLLYRQVQAVVGLGIIEQDRRGGVDLLEPVSGAELLRAVEQLAAVARRHGS